ncbi:transcriptional regulator [Mycobacterium sp. Root265]|uniref:MarR family winged helix-turn-helix transcriptional regulator n=1 Tax=Mycobacterium sp. Root265 TaxID=1736504 RepID=UPI00070BBAD4|nr:MarR family transcriptional regulator [Mycobacterium sp. Root265]KRD05861.1 transcriptional regulator [Mycobacterium sp. Root265]
MSSPSPRGRADSSVTVVMLRAARRLGNDLEAELQRADLGIDHWLVIDVLAGADGLTMAELQSATMIAGPTQTRVVDKLVSRSLMYREVDKFDRRKVRVYISTRGLALHKELRPAVDAVEQAWLDDHAAQVLGGVADRHAGRS